jgi:hypothetical protein
VNSAIAVVKQKMTDSRRQFFAAVKKSEFQGLQHRFNIICGNMNMVIAPKKVGSNPGGDWI